MNLPYTERHRLAREPTHAVDILGFVEALGIPRDYFDASFYLAPVPGAENAYVQLREDLCRSKKIGIAYVEIHAQQHLAVLIPQGQSLVLYTLRWACETGSAAPFGLAEAGLAAAQELAMMALPRASAMLVPAAPEDTFAGAPTEPAGCAMTPGRMPEIVAGEAGAGQDDEDAAADDYLAAVFSRKPHPADGNAMRRRRAPRRRRTGSGSAR